MKRGDAGSWNSGLEKEQILETYSAQLQNSSHFMEIIFGIYKKYWVKKVPEGGPASHKGGGRTPPPGCTLRPCGPPGRPPVPIFCYMVSFSLEKIIQKLSGRSIAVSRRNLGGTNLGLRQGCCARETSLPEGEIIAIIITIDLLIERGSISINIFTSTISSQTLVHLLYPIFVSKPQIGTSGLLVVLIPHCS